MSRQIKIAQVMGRMNGGGVETIIMDYFRHMDRNKIHFDFIVCSDSTMTPYDEIAELGGHVIMVPPYGSVLKYIAALRKAFKQDNYDIVHVNMNILSIFALYAAMRENVPVRITHCHSAFSMAEGPKTALKFMLRPFSKLFATDYFSCGHMAGEWQFGHRAMEKGIVHIIPNGIDTAAFRFDPAVRQSVRETLGINEGTFVLGHVGRFVEQKNHMFLLNIFQKVTEHEPDSILLLVGEGRLMEDVKAKAAELHISENVRFLGQRSDVSALYQAMDVFVLPSIYEGFPIVSVEAQAAGLPCFFSDVMEEEIIFSDKAVRIKINETADTWSYNILSARRYERYSNADQISNKGYDINSCAHILEGLYADMAGRTLSHKSHNSLYGY